MHYTCSPYSSLFLKKICIWEESLIFNIHGQCCLQTSIVLHHIHLYQSILCSISPHIAAFFSTATKLRKSFVLVLLIDRHVQKYQAIFSRNKDFRGNLRNSVQYYFFRVLSKTTCWQRNMQSNGVRISKSVSHTHISKLDSE